MRTRLLKLQEKIYILKSLFLHICLRINVLKFDFVRFNFIPKLRVILNKLGVIIGCARIYPVKDRQVFIPHLIRKFQHYSLLKFIVKNVFWAKSFSVTSLLHSTNEETAWVENLAKGLNRLETHK